jgi:hypothetical protein
MSWMFVFMSYLIPEFLLFILLGLEGIQKEHRVKGQLPSGARTWSELTAGDKEVMP